MTRVHRQKRSLLYCLITSYGTFEKRFSGSIWGIGVYYRKGYHQFHVDIDEVDVHFLSVETMNDLVSDPERVRMVKDSTEFWSKSVGFYRRHLPDDHPWASRIDRFLKQE